MPCSAPAPWATWNDVARISDFLREMQNFNSTGSLSIFNLDKAILLVASQNIPAGQNQTITLIFLTLLWGKTVSAKERIAVSLKKTQLDLVAKLGYTA